MRFKPYTADHHGAGFIWLTPAIAFTVGGPFNKKMVDIAFHWITFGFGLCIEWGERGGDKRS